MNHIRIYHCSSKKSSSGNNNCVVQIVIVILEMEKVAFVIVV